MPRISEFFGIAIYMYWYDNDHHVEPHFHALYAGKMAAYRLDGEVLAGTLGKRANRLVKEWALARKPQLDEAWGRAVKGKKIPWIEPI